MSSEITLKKINNEVIVPPKIGGKKDTRPVKGEKIFSEAYSNIYCCARKNSGKTCSIFKMIKSCAGKNTTILCFASTVNKDANWIAIKEWCKKHAIPFEGFSSIKEGKVNILEEFIHRLEDEAEEHELGSADEGSDDEEDDKSRSSAAQKGGKFINFFGGAKKKAAYDSAESDESSADEAEDMFAHREPTEAERRLFDRRNNRSSIVHREPYLAPEYILIFDDLSSELKTPSIIALLKKNRHYKLKVILSSQYLNDLKPESIKQMDYILLFKGQTAEKLEKVIRDGDLSINFETLKRIYDEATEQPFSFLYIDVRNNQFRKCFDKMYLFSNPI